MVTFSVGLTSTMMANVPVQIINDDVGEPDESFFVTLIPMSSDNDEGLSVPITILDDERECSIVLLVLVHIILLLLYHKHGVKLQI